MHRRALGTSGLDITPIGLGCWAIGGWMWGAQDDADSVAAIHAAVDAGVNWIDTAPIYGSGRSEIVVGRALREIPATRRPLVFTKFGLGDDSAHRRPSASRQEVLGECDASLRRLGVDSIDLYQLHWPVPQPMVETAGACDTLLREGKVRAIGVGNFSVAQLDEWLATGVPLHAVQVPYSVLRPVAASEQLPWCTRRGVGALAYSPLFRGMLFGSWPRTRTFDAGDARGEHEDYQGARLQRHLDAIDELTVIAENAGLSTAQLSVGALLRTPGLTGCIVGARNARQGAHIAELAATVTDQQVHAIEAVTARLRVELDRL